MDRGGLQQSQASLGAQARCLRPYRAAAPLQQRAQRNVRLQPGSVRCGAGDESDSDLDSRISSGEFTDAGSTKERLTRPIRKLLAKDPVGPGEGCNARGGARRMRP